MKIFGLLFLVSVFISCENNSDINIEASNETKDYPNYSKESVINYYFRILDSGQNSNLDKLDMIKNVGDLLILAESNGIVLKRDTIVQFEVSTFNEGVNRLNQSFDSLFKSGNYTKNDLQNLSIQIKEKNDFYLLGFWLETDEYILKGEGSLIAYHIFDKSIYAISYLYPSNSELNIYELTCIYELNESLECMKALKKTLYHPKMSLNDSLIRLEIYDHTKHINDCDFGFSYKSKKLTQLSDLTFETISESFDTTNLETNFVPLDSIAFPTPLVHEYKYWMYYFGAVNDYWVYF